MRSNALALLLLAASAPFGWFACNVIFGIEEPKLREQPRPDTGVPEEDTGCVLAQWPPQPKSEDGTVDVTFVTALRAIELEAPPMGTPIGFDLDGVCTCPGPSSCSPPDAGADDAAPCDYQGGRDISLNTKVLVGITQAPGFSPKTLNANLAKGRYGILAEVRGYNGGRNDKSVHVAVYMSAGIAGIAGDAGAEAAPREPEWDGGDSWDIEPSSLLSGDASPMVARFIDETAYVADGVLVASQLGGVKLTLGVDSEALEIELTQAVFAATIVPRGAGYALTEGTIAGRWPATKALRTIAQVRTSLLGGEPLCSDAGRRIYDGFKDVLCAALDISQNPMRDDIKGNGGLCDAVSFGLRFTSEPALLGGVRARVTNDGGCPGFSDDCPK